MINPSPADEIAELVGRLNSHMGLADMQEVLADCRKAATALERVSRERDEARKELEEGWEPRLKKFTFEDGQFEGQLTGKAVEAIALALVSNFKESGAENYLEFNIYDRAEPFQRYNVTLQKVGKLSPADKANAAEAALTAANTRISEVEQERDELKAAISNPAAVRINLLRGTIAQPQDLVWLHDTNGPVADLRTRISSLEAQAAASVEAEPRLFLDCEFNGFGGELISMALVADDGREWYAVLPEPRVWDKWCFEHVLPLISSVKPTIYATTREEFRVSLDNWLGAYDNPIIVADWYTDMVHFFSAFGGNDHTQSIAYKCRAELFLDGPELPPEHPHNALSDARALRDSYRARSGEAR